MISFEQFKIQDGSPIYLQIIDFIQRGIVAGTIISGDELPSRRALSALLGVNPNTIQKAYRFLEDDGIIASHSGAKSCVTADDAQKSQIRARLIAKDIEAMVQNMKQMGMSREDTLALIEKAWEE